LFFFVLTHPVPFDRPGFATVAGTRLPGEPVREI
jgi:hypothetical protein